MTEIQVSKMTYRGQKGVGRLGVLVFIMLAGALVFVASQVFPFYYYYYELLGLMESQAKKASEFTDAEIKKNILQQIKKTKIPINDPEDLKINRTNNKIIIDLTYEEVLYIDLGEDRIYDLYVFEFNPHIEEPL